MNSKPLPDVSASAYLEVTRANKFIVVLIDKGLRLPVRHYNYLWQCHLFARRVGLDIVRVGGAA